jgi:hypothetical protein
MAEVAVAGLSHGHLHGLAVVAVKAIALDDRGLDALAPKDVLKRPRNGRSARAGRAGDGNDGMFG